MGLRTPTILLVEPDPDTRLLYRLSLQSDSRAVIDEADDGAQALARALDAPPDLVIAELRLPRIDGSALCYILRDEPRTRSVPIIVITTVGRKDVDIVKMRAAGADEVLVAPCAPEPLIGTVRRLLTANGGAAELDAAPAGDRAVEPCAPLSLRCPRCDTPLEFQQTHMGGVSDKLAEQWDYFRCVKCGVLRYRHRTRKLIFVSRHERTA
jgi:DNA-binding response OmpR family regulator